MGRHKGDGFARFVRLHIPVVIMTNNVLGHKGPLLRHWRGKSPHTRHRTIEYRIAPVSWHVTRYQPLFCPSSKPFFVTGD